MKADPYTLRIEIDDFVANINLIHLPDWTLEKYRKMIRLLLDPGNRRTDGPKILGRHLENQVQASWEAWRLASEEFVHGWKHAEEKLSERIQSSKLPWPSSTMSAALSYKISTSR